MKTIEFFFKPGFYLQAALFSCIALVFYGPETSAKENPGTAKKPVAIILKAAPCSNGTAVTDLDINNVRAKILTDDDMWWDLLNAGYEIPKNSGKNSLFAGALWFGGIDASMQIKVAAQTYRQLGTDWWPGPIDTANITTDATVCLAYDRHWKITRASVLDFVQNGTMTNEILTWPGNGDASLNQGHYLAPFHDVNGDGIYDPSQGDYPDYDLFNSGGNCNEGLHGDQTLWWAFNDVGHMHVTGSDPIGLEVHAQAYAFASPVAAIDNATFYQYKIINRSSMTYSNCYAGQWVDPDLGNPMDDFVGCDVTRSMGYCFNGDSFDDGTAGYGIDPPAIGIDFLQGPLADPGDGIDNNRNGFIDEAGEEILMSKFLDYANSNGSPNNGSPYGYTDFYYLLRSVWLDGLSLTYGGNGRDPANPVCSFMYPEDTDSALNASNGPWTEISAGIIPGDRHFIQSAGPFTMLPGEINYVTIGVPWAKALPGGGPASSITELKLADDIIQQLFDSCFITTGISAISENPFQVTVAPVPFHEETIISFTNKNSQSFTLSVYDIQGKLVREIGNITGSRVKLNRNNMADGLYIIKLSDKRGRSYSKKIVVQ